MLRAMTGAPEVLAERFALGALIGRGAFGEVLDATDRTTGQRVAIKRMLPYARSAAMDARFDREAQLLARISHPNVVKYIAHGIDAEDRPWLAQGGSKAPISAKRLVNRAGVGRSRVQSNRPSGRRPAGPARPRHRSSRRQTGKPILAPSRGWLPGQAHRSRHCTLDERPEAHPRRASRWIAGVHVARTGTRGRQHHHPIGSLLARGGGIRIARRPAAIYRPRPLCAAREDRDARCPAARQRCSVDRVGSRTGSRSGTRARAGKPVCLCERHGTGLSRRAATWRR